MLTENQNACSSNSRPETAPELKSVLHHALMRHNHHNRLTHPRPIWIRNPIRIKKTEPPPPIDAAPGRARSHEINTTQPTPSPHPSPTRSTRSSEEPAALLDHKDGAALPRSSAHRATGEGARGKRRSREEAGTVEGRTARGGGGAGRGGAGARPHSGVVRIPAARGPSRARRRRRRRLELGLGRGAARALAYLSPLLPSRAAVLGSPARASPVRLVFFPTLSLPFSLDGLAGGLPRQREGEA